MVEQSVDVARVQRSGPCVRLPGRGASETFLLEVSQWLCRVSTLAGRVRVDLSDARDFLFIVVGEETVQVEFDIQVRGRRLLRHRTERLDQTLGDRCDPRRLLLLVLIVIRERRELIEGVGAWQRFVAKEARVGSIQRSPTTRRRRRLLGR